MENYIDANDPVGFLREIAVSVLPEEVEIVAIDAEFSVELNDGDVEKASEKLLEIMKRRSQLDTRTEDENEQLAHTDARLMLSTIGRNTAQLKDSSQRILWANCYIVTNSRRYIRAAAELGLKNMVCSNPLQLIGIVEQVSGATVNETELLHLYENPIVVGAVEGLWGELQGLLANGISLRGKSLVRLRRDLDACLHERLTLSNAADEKAPEQLDAEEDVEKDEYVQLLDTAEGLGYEIQPMARKARDAFTVAEQSAKRIRELEEQVVDLEEQVQEFGKKKARFLRRVKNRQQLHHKKNQ
ncbi:hypothetical protein [Bremerella cremea]|uniref:hypothetical protein n=1 Tax=Bremerella cremea TaxID=1031537 RepID=UPI0011C03BF1|nr:hypothetical protein [Bremerella cremea]